MLSAMVFIACGLAQAQDSFLEVGEHKPITILINSSPWYAAFESTVGLYKDQTDNQVELDVTPYSGMLEKARNAIRSAQSPQDILNIGTASTIEFYEGQFLKPLAEIEPSYELPENVYTCGDSLYWNAEKRWRTSDGGELMAVPSNCNTHVLVYREDLFDQADLPEPKTYDDVLKACETLQDPPRFYGFVTRGERGNGIRFDWMPFMLGYGAKIVADPNNGDYTVTINSPIAEEALDKFIEIMTTCGPANIGAIGQTDVIQLMAAGKVAMTQAVIASWANFQDPTKSAVTGKVAAAVNPAPAGKEPGVVMGNAHLAVPDNIPEANQKAAMAFIKWFLTKGAQTAYAEAGGIPLRSDVLAELSSRPEFAWMAAYAMSMERAQQVLGYAEGPAVEQVLGLRLNQALIGEMSAAAALNKAAKEIHQIFDRSGRDTGILKPLPE